MAKVRIPTPLRAYAGGQAEVQTAGTTVAEVLGDLTNRYPQLAQHLYAGNGELRDFVNVFLNQEDVRAMQGNQTPVRDKDTLMIIPSIAGGAENRD